MSNHDEFTDKAKYLSCGHDFMVEPIATALQEQYERGVEDAAKICEEWCIGNDVPWSAKTEVDAVGRMIRNLKKTA